MGNFKELGFSNVRGEKGRISGATKNLNIDASFYTGQLDSKMLLIFVQSEPLDIRQVYADYTKKYRAAVAKVDEGTGRFYDIGLLRGGVMRSYEAFLPLRHQKIKSDGKRWDLSQVFVEGYWYEETREVRDSIQDTLGENAKLWIEQFKAGTDEAFEEELAMDALNRSGVLLCQEPDLLSGLKFPRPQDLQGNAYAEAWVINQNNNFESLQKLADNYADCVNAGADAFEALLAEGSRGLDEINRLFTAYRDNRLEQMQKESERLTLASKKYKEQLQTLLKDYFKNEELDANYLNTVAMLRAQSMSQKEQAKLVMSNNGVGNLVSDIKIEIYNKLVACSYRDFQNAEFRSKEPFYPASKEAKFNLALLTLLVKVKNEQYEISDSDIQKLTLLGFSDNEIAVRVDKTVSRLKECTFDVLTDM